MKILILYDTKYGNTAELAESMKKSLSKNNVAICKSISEVSLTEIKKANLLVIGSPTHGGRPTQDMLSWINNLPEDIFQDKKFAAFDTSINANDTNVFLKLLISIIGYAAPKLQAELQKKGGKSITSAVTFYVNGKEGPLKVGERERAQKWFKSLA